MDCCANAFSAGRSGGPPRLGLVDVDSDDDTNATPTAVVDLKPSALVLDRGPLPLRGATCPLICDSGAFLRSTPVRSSTCMRPRCRRPLLWRRSKASSLLGAQRVHYRIGFSCRGGFSAVVVPSPSLYLLRFLRFVQHRLWCCGGVHSIKKVERSSEGRVDVFTCRDRNTMEYHGNS